MWNNTSDDLVMQAKLHWHYIAGEGIERDLRTILKI